MKLQNKRLGTLGHVAAGVALLTPLTDTQTLPSTGAGLEGGFEPGGSQASADAGPAGLVQELDDLGCLFLPNISKRFVGFGARWDAAIGDFVPTKPATLPFTLDPTPVSTGGTFDVISSSELSSLHELERSEFDAAASVYGVKAAVSASRRSSRNIDRAGASFTAIKTRTYEPISLGAAEVDALQWTPEAQAILDLPDPSVVAARWRQEYGDYLIIGYTLRHEVGLTVAANRLGSRWSTEAKNSIEGGFGGFSASAEWGDMAEAALSQESVDISVHYIGTERVDFPLPASIAELNDPNHPAGRANLVANMDALLLDDATASPHGVLVIPWEAVDIQVPPLDPPLLTNVRLQSAKNTAEEVFELLVETDGYAIYPQMRRLLRLRDAAGGTTMLADLQEDRLAVRLALEDLWVAINDYMYGADSSGIDDATEALEDAAGFGSADGLEDVLFDILLLNFTLPQLQVDLSTMEPLPYSSAGGGYCGWWLFRGTLKNAAFLTDTPVADLWIENTLPSAMQLGTPTDYRIYINQYGTHSDPYCNQATKAHEKNFSGLGIRNPCILSVRPAADPNADGLYDVEFAVSAAVSSIATSFDVTLEDDLGRSARAIILSDQP